MTVIHRRHGRQSLYSSWKLFALQQLNDGHHIFEDKLFTNSNSFKHTGLYNCRCFCCFGLRTHEMANHLRQMIVINKNSSYHTTDSLNHDFTIELKVFMNWDYLYVIGAWVLGSVSNRQRKTSRETQHFPTKFPSKSCWEKNPWYNHWYKIYHSYFYGVSPNFQHLTFLVANWSLIRSVVEKRVEICTPRPLSPKAK